MERFYASFGSQPFRSFQLRLFLYLFLIGSALIVLALAFYYVQTSERSEQGWRETVRMTHEQLVLRLEKEMTQLEYAYLQWLQDDSVNEIVKLNSQGHAGFEPRLDAYKTVIGASAAFHMKYRKYVADYCFISEHSTSFCAIGSPFDYDSREMRLPANRYDHYITKDGRNRLLWIGPLYDPSTLVVNGYIVTVFEMNKLLEEIRGERSLSRFLLWSPDSDTLLFESSAPDSHANDRNAAFQAAGGTFLRNEGDLFLSQKSLLLPGGKTWFSYMEMPNTEIRAIKSSLRSTLIAFFAILVIFSAFFSFLIASYFSRPLHTLRQLMKRAESGDLKAYWTSSSMREIDELGGSYNQMLNRLEETIKQVKQEESLKKEAEIEALQYQLNPHFLYNTLNTIKWVAKIHKTPQISEAVSALVRLLQASLGKKGDFLTLKEEIGLIQDYMAIQAFRYGDTIKLRLDIESTASVCLVPKMMLQPLVENALIHGLEHKAMDGEITISAWLDRDMLLCQVHDNGKGMMRPEETQEPPAHDKNAKERMSGIGLKHIREKIKLYYGPDYKMHIYSKPNEGTTIRLSLPIHRIEELGS